MAMVDRDIEEMDAAANNSTGQDGPENPSPGTSSAAVANISQVKILLI